LKDGFSWRGLGQLAVLGAACLYAFAGIFGKRFKKTSPVVNSAGMLVCSSLMMLPLAIFIDSPWSSIPSLESVAAIFGVAIISTVLAYLLYFRILAAAGATNVLLVTFLIPISALLLGVGVLGEVIKALEYIGMGCIFLGLIVIDGRVLKWMKNSYHFSKKVANH
jgi:drug/metabolite transporter (DMT)-like permease